MKQHSILLIGCGDIGVELGRRLSEHGHRVFGVRRHPAALPQFVQGIEADFTHAAQLKSRLAEVRADYVVVTLTPSAFTAAAYAESYGGGARNIVAALPNTPKRLLFISSTSVYHQSNGEWVDEEAATEPANFSGQEILAAETTVLNSSLPSTVVRFAGIYGPGRLRLIKKLQAGEAVTASTSFSNRIHRNDCAGMLEHLMAEDMNGRSLASCYIGVDSEPTPLQEVQLWLARALGLDASIAAASEKSRGGNKRCSNRRILDSGYTFEYPDYRAGYASLLKEAGLGKDTKAP